MPNQMRDETIMKDDETVESNQIESGGIAICWKILHPGCIFISC